MALVGRAREGAAAALSLLPQERKVVVVTEMVREIVGVIGECADHRLVGLPDKTELIPEILDPLAELGEVGGARLLPHSAQPLAPAPVAAMETGSDQLPAVSIELQVIEARPAGDQLGGRASHRPLERAVVVGGAGLRLELLARGPGPLLSSRPEPLPQPVDRLHQDLGIAVGAQLAGDVPVVIVLAAPGVVAD